MHAFTHVFDQSLLVYLYTDLTQYTHLNSCFRMSKILPYKIIVNRLAQLVFSKCMIEYLHVKVAST